MNIQRATAIAALANLAVGDTVVTERNGHKRFTKVAKITPTQIVTEDNRRFYREGGVYKFPGSEVGGSYMSQYLKGKATPGEIEAEATKKAADKKAQDAFQKETARKEALRAELNALLESAGAFVNINNQEEGKPETFTVYIRKLTKAQVQVVANLLGQAETIVLDTN